MFRGTGGALVVALATLLVFCNADPHQEQEVGVAEHASGERYDNSEYKQKEFDDILRFLIQYENTLDNRNLNGIGGSTMIGRNLNGLGGNSMLGRNLGGLGGSSLIGRTLNSGTHGLGGSSLIGRNLNGIGGSTMVGRNVNGLGGSSLLGRDLEADKYEYSRFVDSLGGGNFVRNLDSIGGGNFVRNLDSLGGGNLVKKNLDQLGGPNLVKRTLDSLGGGNLVRNLDSIGGGNFVRELDSIGGHKARALGFLGNGNLVRDARDIRHSSYLPYIIRRYDFNGKREPWPLAPVEYSGYYADGFPKRNFDEIDRSSLNTFVKKRNFDEIDRTSMPFPYATKRFYHLYGQNYLDLDIPVSSFDKKRYRPDFPMDEIDLSHFPIGSKRSQDYPLVPTAV